MPIRSWVIRVAITVAVGGAFGCVPVTRSTVTMVGSWELSPRRDVVSDQDSSLAIAWALLHPPGATASGLAILFDARFP